MWAALLGVDGNNKLMMQVVATCQHMPRVQGSSESETNAADDVMNYIFGTSAESDGEHIDDVRITVTLISTLVMN